MRYLKENTATRVTVGPFLDKTDGITPEIALTVTACLLTFVVDDAGVPTLVLDVAPTASAGANDMVHITSDAAGFYDLELAAANVNYTGRAILAITDAAVHLPVFHEFQIVSANVYDSLFTDGDVLDVNTTTIAAAAAQTVRDEILPTQNVAFNNLPFLWVAASDHVTPVTSATTTSVTRSIDGGAFGSGTGTINEVANGMYSYDASQADMNGGVIIFRFAATGGTPGAPDDAFVTVITGGGV